MDNKHVKWFGIQTVVILVSVVRNVFNNTMASEYANFQVIRAVTLVFVFTLANEILREKGQFVF